MSGIALVIAWILFPLRKLDALTTRPRCSSRAEPGERRSDVSYGRRSVSSRLSVSSCSSWVSVTEDVVWSLATGQQSTLDDFDGPDDDSLIKGAAAIAEALRGNEVLTTLDLRYNDIGPAGGIAIGKALEINEVLTNLVLRNNNIGDEGAKALAAALRVNGVLKSLNLYFNNIGNTGAIAIAEALRGNEVLTDLKLWGNNLGDEGNGVIRDAVSGREGFKLDM